MVQRKRLLSSLPEALRPRLPRELQAFEALLAGRLLKVYYGDPAFHFEVWFHEGKGLVEVAYHGEGPAEANRLLMERLAQYLIQIKDRLGPTAELEPWVRSWVRLCLMIPANSSEAALRKVIVDRLATMITLVQPLVADLIPEEA